MYLSLIKTLQKCGKYMFNTKIKLLGSNLGNKAEYFSLNIQGNNWNRNNFIIKQFRFYTLHNKQRRIYRQD